MPAARDSLAGETGVRMVALFDHEEVGSSTAVGAGSPMMRDCMSRVSKVLGQGEEVRAAVFQHQLQIICETLGRPDEPDLEFITSDKAKRFMRGLPPKPKVPFSTLYPKANRRALDLLDRMLVFNPHRRISVEDALADPYMESLHAEEDEPKAES